MKLRQKKEVVRNLTQTLSEAKAFVLVNFQGLEALRINKLRQDLKAAGGALLIAKNTLIKRAFLRLNLPHLELKGPTAIVLSFNDPIETIKSLFRFIKEEKLPQVKLGFFEGQMLQKEQVLELSRLPSREILLAQLLRTMQGPLIKFATTLHTPQRNLIYVLSGIKNGGGIQNERR